MAAATLNTSGATRQGPDSVRFRAHMRLHAAKIFYLAVGRDGLAEINEHFWHGPPPVFHMTVGEGKIAPLIVAVGRQVPPLIRIWRARPGDSKQRVPDAVFVHIHKDKQFRGGRLGDLREFFERRAADQVRWRAVYRFTHIVATAPQFWQPFATQGHHCRSVRGTMVDGSRTIVLKQDAVLDVRCRGVQGRDARTPGKATNNWIIGTRDIVNEIIWRQPVIIVQRIEVPADLELPEVVQARDIECLRFGFAQAGQEQTCQNGNDGDDDQQLNQGKGKAALSFRGTCIQKLDVRMTLHER